MLALPQKPGLIDDEDAVRIAEHFDTVSTVLITQFLTVPSTTPKKTRYWGSAPACPAFNQAVLHLTADSTPSRKASFAPAPPALLPTSRIPPESFHHGIVKIDGPLIEACG
jgi:hypothetical protein